MASGPGKVLADGEAQVERYLSTEGFTKDEIEDALDLAAETTPSYVIVGARRLPDRRGRRVPGERRNLGQLTRTWHEKDPGPGSGRGSCGQVSRRSVAQRVS